MHLIKLHITGKGVKNEIFFEFADAYFQALQQSNQLLNEEWQYEPIENGVSLNLICPEKDAYEDKNSTIYAKKWKKRMEAELSCRFQFTYQGLAPGHEKLTLPEEKNFLILKTGRFSPLVEGKTAQPIPLYKIPYTYTDGECHNDINFWENNFVRIRGLWFNGAVGEEWAQNQLQQPDSELSNQGIKCCQKIENVTGIPTYYFLFNHRDWGKKKDKKQKCPSCGGKWRIKKATIDDLYAFKCDNCRLLSELSPNAN